MRLFFLKPRREVLVAALLVLAWAFALWVNSYSDFTLTEATVFFVYCFVLLLLAALAYGGLAGRFSRIATAALSGFVVFAVDTLVLNFVDAYATLDPLPQGAILTGLGLGFYFLFAWLRDLAKAPWLVYGLIALFFVQNGVNLVPQLAPQQEDKQHPLSQEFKFSRKPNVYLISFDAMIPLSIAQRYLDIPRLRYAEALERSGMRILKNAFSDGSTISTMNSLVVLDAKKYWNLHNPNYPITDRSSLLYQVFEANGYKLQLVTKEKYLGRSAHSLDLKLVASQQGACEHVHNNFGLMGFCHPQVKAGLELIPALSEKDFPGLLFRRIAKTAQDNSPWVTIGYINSPGHVHPRIYRWPRDFAQYRNKFQNQRDRDTASYITKLLNVIQKQDPTAILVVFGDHGTHYSRTQTQTGNPVQDIHGLMTGELPFSPDQVDEVQDHHGVLVAVYPADFCAEEFSKQPYSLIRVGRSIIKCLSGKDPLPPEVQPNDDFLKPYLYE